MKRFCLIVTIITFILPILLFGNEVVTVEYFFSKDCPECQKVTKLYFPALQDEKGDTKKQIPGSTAFVPSVAGLIIAGEVIKDLTK